MIKKNSVVAVSYSLKNGKGEQIGEAKEDTPLSYLHGYNQIVPGLEKELEGMSVGGHKEVTLTPEEGYGEVDPALKMELPRTNFPADMEIKAGQQFSAEMGEKHQVFTVVSLAGDQVRVDGNHPLAGETLHFSVKVLELREATATELEHGHVHDGGHDHH